ncbi:ribosome bioproteinsis protein ytm1 [Saitozyma podzolica]|uniref:Ribosome biogenesis protein YTM1 n=1 Tax=Saitozyma podzolica TaxID=1890683 RepID=A0A427YI78_9TREE|nr:ribosome bioproteinsis protein ytm1 [Saitozyma podzolica]
MSADEPMPPAGPSGAAAGDRQLPINLFTQDSSHAIPQSTYLLPSSWRRFQLSELINKVLQNTPEHGAKPVPFDFVVEGEVLRGSLEAWVKKHRGGEAERVINVEYRRSVMPPEEMGRVEVEDWVSGLSLGRPGYIMLSSYLSHVQLLPFSSGSTAQPITLPLPSLLGATCCTYVSPPSVSTNIRLAAGGVDRAVHVFELPSLSPEAASGKEIFTLHGHTAPVSSVCASSSGRELISAGWDGQLNLYALPEEIPTEHQIPAEPTSYLPGQKKRRKMEKSGGADGTSGQVIEGLTDGDVGEGGWRRMPDGVMRGHKGRVGGVVWDKDEAGRVWSAGWDGSIRGWEVESGAGAVVRQGPMDKAMLCIDQFSGNGQLATGSMDRTISLWDTREATSLISLSIPTTSPVPSLRCHPTSSFTLAAATYSGTVQIWDVRSPKTALFSVSKAASATAEATRKVTKNGKVLGERLLAVDWDGEVLVAGGEDGEVGIWRARGE